VNATRRLTPPSSPRTILFDLQLAQDSIQRKVLEFDPTGDSHYDVASAFIKSLRGSDPDAAIYWLARMLEAGEDPRYIVRRMIVHASEDIGLADPQALVVVQQSTANSVSVAGEVIGGKRVPLSEFVVKSVQVIALYRRLLSVPSHA
jgi:putative ATPase